LRLADLSYITGLLPDSNVEIFADAESYNALIGKYPAQLLKPATEESFGTEFLSYKMSIKTVASFDEAMEHITRYSSKHSEAIISENKHNIGMFLKMVDASSVYVNASTAFTDGAQYSKIACQRPNGTGRTDEL
jgi:glutamate-5-semialdehyde dehydrogenase